MVKKNWITFFSLNEHKLSSITFSVQCLSKIKCPEFPLVRLRLHGTIFQPSPICLGGSVSPNRSISPVTYIVNVGSTDNRGLIIINEDIWSFILV